MYFLYYFVLYYILLHHILLICINTVYIYIMYTHPVERRASPSHSPMYAAAPTFFPEGSAS